ncbi:iron chelate uptake ABC transporter family permease subunit [Corynebacterium belfantii]|nr:iron chelate uptake ABC transporter family permease subunit [Corynebacterium belfantii]MBG9328153.1 iron chelate uptake ABC transporter family permease subunit [Corynebacterium belfantii]
MNVRLPRALAALLAGVALAVVGATMQAVLRNPLASSSTVGVSQGAAFGAAISVVFLWDRRRKARAWLTSIRR